MTTRLCIDHLRSARARRQAYVGEWPPEPLAAVAGQPLGGHAAVAEVLREVDGRVRPAQVNGQDQRRASRDSAGDADAS